MSGTRQHWKWFHDPPLISRGVASCESWEGAFHQFVEARAAPQEGGSALGDPDGHSKMRGPAAIPALVLMALPARLRLSHHGCLDTV